MQSFPIDTSINQYVSSSSAIDLMPACVPIHSPLQINDSFHSKEKGDKITTLIKNGIQGICVLLTELPTKRNTAFFGA